MTVAGGRDAEQIPPIAPHHASPHRRLFLAGVAGAAIGLLGGMIGLGGAEFRLPLLIGAFGFAALQAVILNKAMSLVVVLTALPARMLAVPPSALTAHWTVAANLLVGSLLGAWIGASWATKMRSATLYKVLAGLLVLIAVALAANHIGTLPALALPAAVRIPIGVLAGLLIGIVAALMGVAGGELLIPTIVLLFAVPITIAGSLSLVVSLPTMLVAFARYSRDDSFIVLRSKRRVRYCDDRWIHPRHHRRRPPPRRRRPGRSHPPARWATAGLRSQGLAPPLRVGSTVVLGHDSDHSQKARTGSACSRLRALTFAIV